MGPHGGSVAFMGKKSRVFMEPWRSRQRGALDDTHPKQVVLCHSAHHRGHPNFCDFPWFFCSHIAFGRLQERAMTILDHFPEERLWPMTSGRF